MRKIMFVLGCSFAMIACGGSGIEEQQAEIESWLIANGTPADRALCVAEGTVDRFTVADFEEHQTSGPDGTLDEDDDSNLDAILVVVNEKCAR